MSQPLVTIGIPSFNRFVYLKEAVRSALAQTYNNKEILISQNPCDDGDLNSEIQSWCQDMSRNHGEIRYRKNKGNIGAVSNFNVILDEAEGEYIAFLGDDDRFLPSFLERLVSASVPGASVVASNQYAIDESGCRLDDLTQRLAEKWARDRAPAGELTNPEIWAWQNTISIYSSIIRREEARQLRFKEHLDNPDIEFFIRLSRKENARFVFVPEYLSEWRVHDESYTARGLRLQRLLESLIPLEVSPEVMPYKRQLIEEKIDNAVSLSLLEGNGALARKLRRSEFYPFRKKMSLKGLILGLLVWMPGRWATAIHRRLHRIKNPSYYELNSDLHYLGENKLDPSKTGRGKC